MKKRILALALAALMCGALGLLLGAAPAATETALETDAFSLTVPAEYEVTANDGRTEFQLLKNGTPACVITQYCRVDDKLTAKLYDSFTKWDGAFPVMADLFTLIGFPYAPAIDGAYGGLMSDRIADGEEYEGFTLSFALPVFTGAPVGIKCYFYFTSDNTALCFRGNLNIVSDAELETLLNGFAVK
jgi:hypothetical protein